MYDSRLGKWLSTDAKKKKYPNISPYSFGGNNPIYMIDPDGNDIIPFGFQVYRNSDGSIKVVGTVQINIQVINLSSRSNNDAELSVYDYARQIQWDLTNILNNKDINRNIELSPYTTENSNLKLLSALQNTTVTYDIAVKVNVTVAESKDQIRPDAHVHALVDGYKPGVSEFGDRAEVAGLAQLGGRISTVSIKYITPQSKEMGYLAGVHEILHNFGLEDIYDSKDLNKVKTKNYMNSLGYATKSLTSKQLLIEGWGNTLGRWNVIWDKLKKEKDLPKEKYETTSLEELNKFIDKNAEVKNP